MIGNASHTKTALPDKDNSHAESSRNAACDTAMIKLSVPLPRACRKPVSICVVVVRRSDAAIIRSAGIPISRTASDASNMASRSCGTARKIMVPKNAMTRFTIILFFRVSIIRSLFPAPKLYAMIEMPAVLIPPAGMMTKLWSRI